MKKYFLLIAGLAFIMALNSCNQDSDKVYIRVNQAGYHPAEKKSAIIISNAEIKENFVIESVNGEVCIENMEAVAIDPEGWGTFQYYYRLDFSELDIPGIYTIKTSDSGSRSVVFPVSGDVYSAYSDHLLGFMRQQRCGYNPFLDVECHLLDGKTMYGPMADSTFVDVSGGWHDAGDQLKYLITGSYATAHMLKAYEIFRGQFNDKVDSLGRPGPNGTPDILDEAAWGLQWILKMHPAPGLLFHQVADDRDHIGWKMPDNDRSDYGWGENSYRLVYFANGEPQGLQEAKSTATGVSNLAGRCAAALAMAYIIWKDDPEKKAFAGKCLERAQSVFRLGLQNEGFQQGNSYGAPYRYNEDTWADDMEWGAAELYRATGDEKYLKLAKDYALKAADVSWMPLDTADHYRYYPFVNVGHYALYDLVDEDFKKLLSDYYKTGIEYCMKRAGQNVYNVGVPFIWCSNNLLTSLITQIIFYEDMTSDLSYHDFLTDQVNWLFGVNPWATSMFTGLPEGGEYPVDVHTSIWALTGKEVAGGLVDGPVYATIYSSLKGIALSEEDEFAEFQNDYVVYHDDISDYSTNEPTMDGTAGSLIMMSWLEHNRDKRQTTNDKRQKRAER
ncbi:MAG: glycoside hydrolase family 9 protein [Bacteroidales bacterium]|nr:glycoside hydrolase family 9 protein [Bacteroidales bacterium]